jgi:nucleotide-binding universal stress UspA family protein
MPCQARNQQKEASMFYHPNMISGMPTGLKAHVHAPFQRLGGARPSPSAAHRTLIPVDGSEGANRAVEHAIDLVRRGLTSEIHLLNVQPLQTHEDFALNPAVEAEQRARLANARQVLSRARGLLRDAGEDGSMTIAFGAVAPMIARYARDNGVDAIVMGTRGQRGLGRLLGGSVAAAVTQTADVPVTVVRLAGPPRALRDGRRADALQAAAAQ